jgi:hypothetical protein
LLTNWVVVTGSTELEMFTTDNSCWGRVKVEDKLAPELACASCEQSVSGVLQTTDVLGNRFGFNATATPTQGTTCLFQATTPTDYVQFTLDPTSSGLYTFRINGSQPVTATNFASQLAIALYSAQPDPANSCTNAIRLDGQSLNPTLTTANGHFTNVTLVPGQTYWLAVQMVRSAPNFTPQYPNAWSVEIIDNASGASALTSPENCAIDCIDKDALLGLCGSKYSTASINNIVNVCGIPRPEVVSWLLWR